MSKTWAPGAPPSTFRYSAKLISSYEIQDLEFLQECAEAAKREKYPFKPSCGSFGVNAALDFSLSPNSETMRLTEPQPPGSPEEVTAITLTRDDPLWSENRSGAFVGIWGFDMIAGGQHSAYHTKTAFLRLERVEGTRWRFTVNIEAVPVPEAEDLLKKYNLWAETIRFSATCECDVGAYETDCIGD